MNLSRFFEEFLPIFFVFSLRKKLYRLKSRFSHILWSESDATLSRKLSERRESDFSTVMKNSCKILSFLLLFCILSVPVTAAGPSSGVYHWYCKKTADHSVPPLGEDLKIIEHHCAYYCNDHVKEGDKVIYLTFDAGYENGNVAKIADTLRKHHAIGAFFVLEHTVKQNPDLIRTLQEDGHLLCNHTATHKNMSKITDEAAFQAELSRMEQVYSQVTGKELDKFYRPPEGTFSRANLEHAEKMGYTTVFWSFAYADWDNKKQPDPEASLQKLIDHLHNGEILLLHPTSTTNAKILDRFLTEAESQGYRFGSLYELCQK